MRPKLPGNVQAALLQKTTRGGAVNLRLTLRDGNETNLRGLAAVCEFLPDLNAQSQRGCAPSCRTCSIKSGPSCMPTGTPARRRSTTAKRSSLPAMLDLLRQVLREPSLPEDELETLRHEAIAAMEKQLNDPQPLAGAA